MTYVERIPVRIVGIDVGSARIDEDGTIEITMNKPNPLGQSLVQEILKHILTGYVEGLSISPIVHPAIDAKLTSRSDRQTPLSEFGGFQYGEGNAPTKDISRYLRNQRSPHSPTI